MNAIDETRQNFITKQSTKQIRHKTPSKPKQK